tara:strand:+ start:288 stop:734 length:447 start_codon:yes stop_codon:yes gene_type:complete
MGEISDNEDSSSSEEELEVVSKIEKPKRVYNRKPMTESAVEEFKERMKKARESKKNKAEGITPPILEKEKEVPKPKGRPKKIVIPKEEEPKQSSTKEPTIVNNYFYDSKPKKETKSKKETKARVPRVKKEKVDTPKKEPPKIPVMQFA